MGGSRGRPAGAPKGVLQVAWERHSPTHQEKEPRSFSQSSPLRSDADPHQRCSSLQTQPRGDGGHQLSGTRPVTPTCRHGVAGILSASALVPCSVLPCTPSAPGPCWREFPLQYIRYSAFALFLFFLFLFFLFLQNKEWRASPCGSPAASVHRHSL